MPNEPRVAERLHSAAIHLLRRLRRTDDETGVGPARLSALSVLVFGGPRSLGELAHAEQVRVPTMSRLAKALEAEGFVRREPDPDDGRALRIVATARGRRVLEHGRRRRIETLDGLLATLSAAERRDLARGVAVLEKLVSLR